MLWPAMWIRRNGNSYVVNRRVFYVFGFLFVLAVGYSVYLQVKLHKLDAEYREDTDRLSQMFGLQKSHIAPDLSGTLDGKPVQLNLRDRDRPALVLFTYESCRFCEQNWPNWQTLIDAAKHSSVDVFIATTDEQLPNSYISRHHIDKAGLISAISEPVAQAWRFDGAPQTVLLSRTGVVLYAAAGVLDKPKMDQFKAGFAH